MISPATFNRYMLHLEAQDSLLSSNPLNSLAYNLYKAYLEDIENYELWLEEDLLLWPKCFKDI